MSTLHKIDVAALLAAGLLLTGCGTPGAPQPPSLNLPERVTDLSAIRAGNQVSLSWTMPDRNTDKLLLKNGLAIPVRICRKEGSGNCDLIGVELALAPGTDGIFNDTLPAALAAGQGRSLSYFVELRNRNGHSAGLSNDAIVIAGSAPPPVAGLTAESSKQGVVLHWTPAEKISSDVRLHRKLLTPPAAKPHEGPLAPSSEPIEQSLLVAPCIPDKQSGMCSAVDKNIRLGQIYEYRAQRVERANFDGRMLELADGELSAPVRVEVKDIYPPEIPIGLAAVATAGENGAAAAIDLSWQPVAGTDLSGYAVYRSERVGEGDATWQRISPAGPLVPPAFHDAPVQPGHTYHYSVSSIGQNGHESARSAETEETVPNP